MSASRYCQSNCGVQRGFTMVELMIVVAIVAVLAAIAYPSYQEHVLRTKRSEGKALLNRVAGEQERFFTARGRYTANLTGAKPAGLGFADPVESERGCYEVEAELADDEMSYVLTATPLDAPGRCGDQTRDERCATLTLSSLGVKGATGTDAGSCW